MPLYRKKPVVIEARQLTVESCPAIYEWLGYGEHPTGPEVDCATGIDINTLEGIMHAGLGDWIIKGVNGEFYPCKPDAFAKSYEPAGSAEPMVAPV